MCRRISIPVVLLSSLLIGPHESQATEDPSKYPYPLLVYAAASELSYHANVAKDSQYPNSEKLVHDEPADDWYTVTDGLSCSYIKENTLLYAQMVIYKAGLKVIPFKNLGINLCDYSALKDRSPLLLSMRDGKNFILSFRGTDGGEDVAYDILGGIGVVPQPYLDAERLTAAVIDKLLASKNEYPDFATITTTGHSLGGGIAEYAAGKNGIYGVTFNSAHLSQPYIAKDGALVYSYYNNKDKVRFLRIGGVYDFVSTLPIDMGSSGIIVEPHRIATTLSYLCKNKGKDITQPSVGYKPTQKKDLVLRRNKMRDLLESSPNLEDGIPSILHNGMRVAAIRNQHKNNIQESNSEVSSPLIVDTAFRLGIIHDTYPAGGINIDSLRTFDLSQTKQIKTKSDFARDWRAALSVSYSSNSKLSLIGTVDYQELDYDAEDEFDFDVFEANVGIAWHDNYEEEGRGVTNSVSSLSLVMQRFRNQDEDIGLLLGLDTAMGWTYDDNLMFWVHGTGGKVVNSDAEGGDGYAVLGDAGIRYMLPDSIMKGDSSIQLRVFGGRREAQSNIITNTQWGAGVGLYSKWGEGHKLSTFIEPSIRWNHHHLVDPENDRYADREYAVRAEVSYPLDIPLFEWGALRGWAVSAGYTYSHSDAAAKLQNYDRHQLLLQLDKQF